MRFRLTVPTGNDASATAHSLAGAAVVALLDGSAIVELGLYGDGGGHLIADGRLGTSDLEAFADGPDVIRMAKEAAEVRYRFGSPGPGRISPIPDTVRALVSDRAPAEVEADWATIWTLIDDPVCGCAILDVASHLLAARAVDGRDATDLVRKALETESAVADKVEEDFRYAPRADVASLPGSRP